MQSPPLVGEGKPFFLFFGGLSKVLEVNGWCLSFPLGRTSFHAIAFSEQEEGTREEEDCGGSLLSFEVDWPARTFVSLWAAPHLLRCWEYWSSGNDLLHF